jgi:hypothetical protein
MITILIFAVSLILAKTFLWPWLSQYQPADDSSWRTMLGKDLPQFLVNIIKIGSVLVGAVVFAALFNKPIEVMASDSFSKLIVIAGLILVCFIALDRVLSKKVQNNERVLLWGTYGLVATLLLHSKVPHLTLDPNTFLFGVGVYLIAMIGVWALCYWSRMQNIAALPIAYALVVGTLVYDKYLNTGELLLDVTSPNWVLSAWPFLFANVGILGLMFVFYKKVNWRRRLAYPILFSFFVFFIGKNTMPVALLLTDDISGSSISGAMSFNKTRALYTKAMVAGIEVQGSKAENERRIKEIKEDLETGVIKDPTSAIKELSAKMSILQEIERRKKEVYKNRPEKMGWGEDFIEMVKEAWQEYATPLIERSKSLIG